MRRHPPGLTGPGERRAALLLATVASVNASYTVLIPLVPELRHRTDAGPTVIALTFALFAGAKAAVQPVAGRWVDRWRPGPVACVSLMVAAAGIAVTALAHDPLTLLSGRACWGAGEGGVTPALYTGLMSLCQRYRLARTRLLSGLGTAAVTGFLVGPLITGLAAGAGVESLLLGGAATIAAAAFVMLAALRAADAPTGPGTDGDTTGQDADSDTAVAQRRRPRGIWGRWWLPVLALGGLDLLTNLSYSALEPTLPLYLIPAGSLRGALSAVFAAGLATFGVTSVAIGRRADRIRLVTLIQAGLAGSAAGLAGLALSRRLASVLAWFILIMVAQAVLYLAARRGVAHLGVARASMGAAFGLFGMASDIGNSLGPVIGVALFESTGRVSFALLGGLSALVLLGQLCVVARPAWRHARPGGTPELTQEPALTNETAGDDD